MKRGEYKSGDRIQVRSTTAMVEWGLAGKTGTIEFTERATLAVVIDGRGPDTYRFFYDEIQAVTE